MKHPKMSVFILAAAMSASTLAVAKDKGGEEVEFEEAYLYFELNDTDSDLGLHGKVDGDGWKKVKIEGPDDRKILELKVKSGLKRQGMTELFFESSEPTFDELDPLDFFDRFPEGLYEWEGKTLDGVEIEGEVYLSQRIPAAPVVAMVGGDITTPTGEENVDECWVPTNDEIIIAWNPVTHTHASLGSDTGTPPGTGSLLGVNNVIYYEFVLEIDDTEFKTTALVHPDVTEWTVPGEFIDMAENLTVDGEEVDEIKFEIIVRVETGEYTEIDDGEMETVDSRPGNQSAVESCFEI